MVAKPSSFKGREIHQKRKRKRKRKRKEILSQHGGEASLIPYWLLGSRAIPKCALIQKPEFVISI
jgi:hypothetical protein